MSADERGPLRIALLHDASGSTSAAALAAALCEAGHEALLLSSRPGPARRLIEGLLRRRGMDGPLTQLPSSIRALRSGGYDVAHAFSPPDALAAHVWRRLSGRPVVYTCAGVLERERLAHRRLRLELLRRAVEGSDAVIAPTERAREALDRWMAVEAAVIESHDATGHERLYRRLLGSGR